MPVSEWPYPILLYLNGELPLALLRAKVGSDNGRATEVSVFVGLKAMYDGNVGLAEDELSWTVEYGEKTYYEYELAQAELDRLRRGGSKQIGATARRRSI